MKYSILATAILASGTTLATVLPTLEEKRSTCNESSLNTTVSYYPITTYPTSIWDIAAATNRGLCDIARANLMIDVTVTPNIGQDIVIPGEVCVPDDTTCLLPRSTAPRDCINGGPRLYYTVNNDTYEYVALYRLNITVEAFMGTTNTSGSTDVLEAGQFLKVPLCSPSECVTQPYTFGEQGVYKDLADKYGSTVGQIMMLSPTYNYSTSLFDSDGRTPPSIVLPINCTALSSNITVLS